MKILLLCQYDPFQAQAVSDHIEALAALPGHQVDVLSFGGEFPAGLHLDHYDALIVHYSTFIYEDRCLSPAARWQIRNFTGLKAVFLHDEYKHVDLTCRALSYLDAHILFTVIPEQAWQAVYPREKIGALQLVNVLTGYVPQNLVGLPSPGAAGRPIDIGYRGRLYPAWHGRPGQERVAIARKVAEDAPRYGLKADIGLDEASRLYGRRWTAFLARCKATLGTESDVGVIDFTGEIAEAVESHQRAHPEVSYEELRAKFFAEEEGRISIAQISPRIFEAIALRSLLILYEGRYSGVIEPGRHYVPLLRDHSNFAEIAALLKNPEEIDRITARAYDEVIGSGRWAYAAFSADVGKILAERLARDFIGRPTTRGPQPPAALFSGYRSPLHRHVLKSRSRYLAARAFARSTRFLGEERQGKARNRLKALLSSWRRGRPSGSEAGLSGRLAGLHAVARTLSRRLGGKVLAIEIDPASAAIRIGPADDPAQAGWAVDPDAAHAAVAEILAAGGGCEWLGGEALGIAPLLFSPEPITVATSGRFADTGAAIGEAAILPDDCFSYACIRISEAGHSE